MFDKFEHACQVYGWRGQYTKMYERLRRHRIRYKKYVERHGLTCQDCHGLGGETDVILDDGTGPWEECGYCEGTGLITRHMRGLWLTWKREDKRQRKESHG